MRTFRTLARQGPALPRGREIFLLADVIQLVGVGTLSDGLTPGLHIINGASHGIIKRITEESLLDLQRCILDTIGVDAILFIRHKQLRRP